LILKTSLIGEFSIRFNDNSERWREEKKLVSGTKHQGACGSLGVLPPKIFWDCIWRILQFSAFYPEMVRNAVHNAFLNILTMGRPFPRVPSRNDH